MTYAIEFGTRDDIFVTKATGEVCGFEQLKEYAYVIVNEAVQRGFTRILIDDREISFELDAHDAHQLASYMESDSVQQKGLRLACLYSPPAAEVHRMFETSHQNRSLSFKVFLDEEAGVDWLRS